MLCLKVIDGGCTRRRSFTHPVDWGEVWSWVNLDGKLYYNVVEVQVKGVNDMEAIAARCTDESCIKLYARSMEKEGSGMAGSIIVEAAKGGNVIGSSSSSYHDDSTDGSSRVKKEINVEDILREENEALKAQVEKLKERICILENEAKINIEKNEKENALSASPIISSGDESSKSITTTASDIIESDTIDVLRGLGFPLADSIRMSEKHKGDIQRAMEELMLTPSRTLTLI